MGQKFSIEFWVKILFVCDEHIAGNSKPENV